MVGQSSIIAGAAAGHHGVVALRLVWISSNAADGVMVCTFEVRRSAP
jgi:hypothetical protein